MSGVQPTRGLNCHSDAHGTPVRMIQRTDGTYRCPACGRICDGSLPYSDPSADYRGLESGGDV